MINNESTSKDRGEYGGDAHVGEQGGYDRESSREEYKGGYDPGFLAGGDGYRRTGKDRGGFRQVSRQILSGGIDQPW